MDATYEKIPYRLFWELEGVASNETASESNDCGDN